MQPPRSARPVGAVLAAARILRHLSEAGRPQRVNEIARALDLYPGTCFQILWTLVGEQLATFEPASKTYGPGLGLVELSQGALKRVGVPEIARPGMRRFAARHDVSVFLLHRSREDSVVVLEHARSGSDLDLHVVIGSAVSAWQGATGRVVAAASELSPAELRKRFDRERWQDAPPFEEWLADVGRAREASFAIDRGHRVRGVVSMAVPIHDPARPGSLFLTTFCLEAQKQEEQIDRIASELRELGAEIESGLGLIRAA